LPSASGLAPRYVLLRHSLLEEDYVQLVVCLQGGLCGEAGRLTKALALFWSCRRKRQLFPCIFNII